MALRRVRQRRRVKGRFQTACVGGGERWGGDITGASGPPEEILWLTVAWLQTFKAEEFEFFRHSVVIPGDFLEAS